MFAQSTANFIAVGRRAGLSAASRGISTLYLAGHITFNVVNYVTELGTSLWNDLLCCQGNEKVRILGFTRWVPMREHAACPQVQIKLTLVTEMRMLYEAISKSFLLLLAAVATFCSNKLPAMFDTG